MTPKEQNNRNMVSDFVKKQDGIYIQPEIIITKVEKHHQLLKGDLAKTVPR